MLLRWGIGVKKRQKGTTREEVKETQVVGRRPEHRRNVEENVRRVRSLSVGVSPELCVRVSLYALKIILYLLFTIQIA